MSTTRPTIEHTGTVSPGVYLNIDQSRRVLALGAVLALVQGRSTPIGTVWDLARWVETGEVASTHA